MSDLNYLRVEGDRITGSYGSFLQRSDLTDVRYRKSKRWEQKPAAVGYMLVLMGPLVLWLIQETPEAERATWPIYQTFGSLTILVVLGAIGFGVYLIIRRRRVNALIPDTFVMITYEGEIVTLLETNDLEWAVAAADKLASLKEPGSGNYEFIASEGRISEV